MKRPRGSRILALLLLLTGAALAILAGTLLFHPQIGVTFSYAYLRDVFPSYELDAASMMLFSGIASAFSLLIGGGLLLLAEKARWVLILAAGLPLGWQVIGIATALVGDPSARVRRGDVFWFQSIASGGILWYLFQPKVRCAFVGRKQFYDAYADLENDRADRRS